MLEKRKSKINKEEDQCTFHHLLDSKKINYKITIVPKGTKKYLERLMKSQLIREVNETLSRPSILNRNPNCKFKKML